MLGEATTTGLTRTRDSKDFPALKGDAHEGGEVSGTRGWISRSAWAESDQRKEFFT